MKEWRKHPHKEDTYEAALSPNVRVSLRELNGTYHLDVVSDSGGIAGKAICAKSLDKAKELAQAWVCDWTKALYEAALSVDESSWWLM